MDSLLEAVSLTGIFSTKHNQQFSSLSPALSYLFFSLDQPPLKISHIASWD